MIKALLRCAGNKDVFFVGLSDRNVGKLKEKLPILVDLEAMGGPKNASVLISWGPTEQAIADELKSTFKAVAPEAVVPEATDEDETQFPRGKIRPDDQGASKFALSIHKDGALVISFPKPLTWLGLDIAGVEALIGGLQDQLVEMKKRTA